MSGSLEVINGRLCVTEHGVRIWYTIDQIRRAVSELETDLAKWRSRLAMLEAPTALQAEAAITETVPTPPEK